MRTESPHVAAPGRMRRSGLRLTPGATAIVLVMVALLVYLVVPLQTYLAQRERLAELERRTRVLERRNVDLKAEVARLRDPAHVEEMARCLGMVRPGEVAFVVVPRDGEPQPPGC